MTHTTSKRRPTKSEATPALKAKSYEAQKTALLEVYFMVDVLLASEGQHRDEYSDWKSLQKLAGTLVRVIQSGGLMAYVEDFVPYAQARLNLAAASASSET